MAILDTLARDTSLKQSARRLTNSNDLWQDLFHHSILKLYDLGEDRVVGLYTEGNIAGYMAVIMHREWHDKSSKFNKTYRPQGEVSIGELTTTDEYGEPMTIGRGDIDLCREYFGEDCIVSPERVILARSMQSMKQEDNNRKDYHYRTALLELYIREGGISQVSRATKIDRVTVRKDLKEAINQIKKNGEGTTH